MNFVTKKHIARHTMLRGAGAAIVERHAANAFAADFL